MTIAGELREQVRQRANLACEYCGVTETDTAGELTVDHFRPRSCDGDDDPSNLLYCCHRCNLYKSHYWPVQPSDPVLWNPRLEPAGAHLLALADGSLYPLTPTGAFTLKRLRLNRPPLVAFRRRRFAEDDELRLLTQYRDVVALLEQLQQQHATLLEEHRQLLDQQRALLKLMLKGKE